jgi:hypothetical protein
MFKESSDKQDCKSKALKILILFESMDLTTDELRR